MVANLHIVCYWEPKLVPLEHLQVFPSTELFLEHPHVTLDETKVNHHKEYQ